MDAHHPSHTARGAALLRAAHLIVDASPPVFVDTLAGPLCGAHDARAVSTLLTALHQEAGQIVGSEHADAVLRAVRAAVLTRSRYTEEVVEAVCAHGTTQYVILGTGLDSFAYRRRSLLDRLHVYEVDHPVTQQEKRAQLAAAAIAVPAALTFVPMDLVQQPLLSTLGAHGYRTDKPAVFSCLGVSQYLPAPALASLLTQLATAAPESLLLLGYLVAETLLDRENRRVRTFLNHLTAARGEPIVTDFVPETLARQLTTAGFTQVQDLGTEHGLGHYTAGRTDGVSHPQTHRLIQGWVGAVVRE